MPVPPGCVPKAPANAACGAGFRGKPVLGEQALEAQPAAALAVAAAHVEDG
jgi:hypothetical protein